MQWDHFLKSTVQSLPLPRFENRKHTIGVQEGRGKEAKEALLHYNPHLDAHFSKLLSSAKEQQEQHCSPLPSSLALYINRLFTLLL